MEPPPEPPLTPPELLLRQAHKAFVHSAEFAELLSSLGVYDEVVMKHVHPGDLAELVASLLPQGDESPPLRPPLTPLTPPEPPLVASLLP